MTLDKFIQQNPYATVTLFFESAEGAKGRLSIVAAKIVDLENLSGRVFPPEGTTAASLGWEAPWFYGQECTGWREGRA